MKFKLLKQVAWMTVALSSTAVLIPLSHAEETQQQQSAQAQAAALNEGLEARLTPEELSVYKVYADKSNASLGDLLKEVRRMPYSKAKERMMEAFKTIAIDSAPKGPEILLRFILNRGRDLVNKIDTIADVSRPGVIDQEVRILRRSAELAIKYYPNDRAYLNTNASLNTAYASFGIEYARLMMQVNESLVNAKAQYAIAITGLVHLETDLKHDRSSDAYGRVIVKIGRFINNTAVYPDPERQPLPSSTECVNKMRDIRRAYFDSMEILEGTQVSSSQ
jgi:hypothetical protein